MKFVVDDIGTVVSRMRGIDISYGADALTYLTSNHPNSNKAQMPFYMYGHKVEMANRLTEKTKDRVFKYQKYPLVALRLDVPENIINGRVDFELNIAILCSTEQKYNAEERMEKVFKPILYPLYERFMEELSNSGLFVWQGLTPEHTKIDRPFWGEESAAGNTKYIFNDPLDAIEILNLKLSQFNCK